MANFLNTRIRLKYDTYQNWTTNNPTLLSGELAIVEVPNADQMAGDNVKPQILFKVGPGAFNSLPWASAKAADVHAWAKAEKLTIEKAAGQTGNVVSEISWDATNNKVTYTTASVATSEGLKDIQDRVDALETKEDKDTTYTFAKTTKGFTITPKGGSAQTISFEYLTQTEIEALTVAKAKGISRDSASGNGSVYLPAVDSNGNFVAAISGWTSIGSGIEVTTSGQRDAMNTLKANISGNAATATKATQDANGNVITATYATKQYVDTTADDINKRIDDLDAQGIEYSGLAQDEVGETVDDAITNLCSKVLGNTTAIDNLSKEVATNSTEIEDLSKEIAVNATAIDELSKEVATNAAAIEQNVGAIDYLSKEIEANATAIEALTNGTSTEEIDSVMELVDYVNKHGTEVQGMKNDIKANADAIDVIEAKPAMGITSTNISDWNDAVSKEHTHSNKTVLDNITTTKVSSWDDAVGNKHSHANKALLDTYTQTEANLADAVSKKHSHANKTVIDGITAAQVSNWNDAYTLLNQDYGFVKEISIYDNGARHEYGLSIYQENNEEGTENFIKLDDIKLNTGSYIGKTLGTFVSDFANKNIVQYYTGTDEDYSKGSFVICCGTSSKLV